MKKSLVLTVAVFFTLGGTARADEYQVAAQVLVKYAKELVPSKKGMVEAGLAAVAFEWLKANVWAAEPKPPPQRDPTAPPLYDFGAARDRACMDPSLGRDMASFLGCPGQQLRPLKSGDIDPKLPDYILYPTPDELRGQKCMNFVIAKISDCMATGVPP